MSYTNVDDFTRHADGTPTTPLRDETYFNEQNMAVNIVGPIASTTAASNGYSMVPPRASTSAVSNDLADFITAYSPISNCEEIPLPAAKRHRAENVTKPPVISSLIEDKITEMSQDISTLKRDVAAMPGGITETMRDMLEGQQDFQRQLTSVVQKELRNLTSAISTFNKNAERVVLPEELIRSVTSLNQSVLSMANK